MKVFVGGLLVALLAIALELVPRAACSGAIISPGIRSGVKFRDLATDPTRRLATL